MLKFVNPLVDKIIIAYTIIASATLLITSNVIPLIIYSCIAIISMGIIIFINRKKWSKKELLHSIIAMLAISFLAIIYYIV